MFFTFLNRVFRVGVSGFFTFPFEGFVFNFGLFFGGGPNGLWPFLSKKRGKFVKGAFPFFQTPKGGGALFFWKPGDGGEI